MKQETMESIKVITELLKEQRNNPSMTEHCDNVIKLFNSLPELEKTLSKGGVVKDSRGDWLKDGDPVYYWQQEGCLIETAETGIIYFDEYTLQWYVKSKYGEHLPLGYHMDKIQKFVKKEV